MKKILIFGAGSIGNHMTNACIKLGFQVYITDKSNKALAFMKNDLFKKRYGYWNEKNIKQIQYENLNKLNDIIFDLIILGTPPKSHLMLAEFCKKNYNFKNLLIEKPLCSYKDDQNKFEKFYKENKFRTYCGYNHSISPAIKKLINLANHKNDQLYFIDVKWKEGWKGIMNAHYWLKDEFSSYLGDMKSGGGALQEHSHGLHLSLYLMEKLFSKNYICTNYASNFKSKKEKKYDYFNNLNFKSKDKNLALEIDLIEPTSLKQITLNFKSKTIRWNCNFKKNLDIIQIITKKGTKTLEFKKTRESEFANEMKHIFSIKSNKNYKLSPINVLYGIKTMNIIKKVFKKIN